MWNTFIEVRAESNTGNKQWVGILTDTNPKYNYDRDFVAYQQPKTSNRDRGTATVEDGAFIKRVRYTHSGKNRKDSFYQLIDGKAYRIDVADIEAALKGEIVADVPGDEDEPVGDAAHGAVPDDEHGGLVGFEDASTLDEAFGAISKELQCVLIASVLVGERGDGLLKAFGSLPHLLEAYIGS